MKNITITSLLNLPVTRQGSSTAVYIGLLICTGNPNSHKGMRHVA